MDYRDFGPNGNPNQKLDPVNKRWWLLEGEKRAQAIEGVIKVIYDNDSRRQTQYQISQRLYGNVALMGITGFAFSRSATNQQGVKDRITYNIVQSAIDTVTSKIAKNKPKPMFLTSGGDYKLQRRAKKLDKFVTGVFYENEAYSLGQDIFRDGAVIGDGFIKIFEHNGRIKMERAYAGQLYVDQQEARYGKPRQLHEVRAVDRDVLIDLFPDHKKEILLANPANYGTDANANVADQINVMESWHLPSGFDKDGNPTPDGVHCICIEGHELFTEPWKKSYFPFARFSWCKRSEGYWSQGGAEQIQGIQLEVNKLLWVIQRSYHLAGSFKVLLPNGSKVVKEHLNNDIGAIVTYSGDTPPQYVTTPIIQPEIYQWLTSLKQSAYEQLGVSMLSSTSQKPQGLDSGKALREFNDIESDRFMVIGQRYESLFLECSNIIVDMAADIFEREGSFEVKVPGKKFIETIDWGEVSLEEDQYQMQMFPVSSLPQTPQGRLQTIQEYMQAGLVNPRTGRKLLDFPDLEAVENVQNSPEEYLTEVMDKMLYEGKYTPPEPFDDLDLARELALQYYSWGKQSAVPNKNLEMLRRFIEQCNLLQQKAVSAMAPPPTGAQANPEAPPTSDLLPNAPPMPTPEAA